MWNSDGCDPFERPKERLFRLSWDGNYWGENGAIALSELVYSEKMALGDQSALSGLSSIYYSAAGNAASRTRSSTFLGKPFWLLRAFRCLRKAEKLSDELERKVGVSKMSPDELDIRSSILRKAHRCDDALRCTQAGLSRSDLSPDTRVLLEIGLGEIMDEVGNNKAAGEAYARAIGFLMKIKPTTRVRYFKSLAEHYHRCKWHVPARNMAIKALKIAEDSNLTDQVVKIKPALAKYERLCRS